MSFDFIHVFKYYEGLPHQDRALQHIQDALASPLNQSIGLAGLGMPLGDLKLELGGDAQFQIQTGEDGAQAPISKMTPLIAC